MNRQIKAVYTQGVFRPANPDEIRVTDGDTVWLQVFTPSERVQYLLELAAQVYDGLSEEQIAEMEAAMQRRHPFFSRDVAVWDDEALAQPESAAESRA